MNDGNLLKIENLSKSFGENVVLRDINLTIAPGEIVGLVGENGAGKSTLMKTLFGMSEIKETGGYDGSIYIDGQLVNFNTPFDALNAGVGMVHQEFSLIPGFKAEENIVLNRESVKSSVLENLFGSKIQHLDGKKIRERAENAIGQLGVDIKADAVVEEMPVAHKQFTEIAREIEREKTKILMLDEPTAVLTEKEAEVLLDIIRKISQKGIAVIFITHRLEEIMNVCDKVVVLRDGILINTAATKDTNVDQVTEWMIGRKVDTSYTRDNSRQVSDEVILSIRDLCVDMPGESVKKLNLDVRKGEILGIGGMAGQGKIGIANGIMGLYYATGEVTYKNETVKLNDPLGTIKKGLFFVSEDRKGVGLILGESIKNNIAFPAVEINGDFISKKFLIPMLDNKAITENADKFIKSLEIRCMGSSQKVKELSGGNQQKVCIAKAFTMAPDLLFVSEPTRGIDVGAKKLVLETLKQYNAERGTTIVITSSEIEELRSVCDRIAIINDGSVIDILPPTADIVEFGKLMVGIKGGARTNG